jgi:hypothetical protein
MKFLTIFLAIILTAATAEAQRGGGGFHGGGGFGGGGFHGGGGFRGGGFHGGGFHNAAPIVRPGFGVHPGFAPRGFVNPAFRPGFHSGVVVGPGFRGGFGFGFGHVRPFGSSVFVSPFFGFGAPFYPYAPVAPFYSQPIYSAPMYIAPDQTVTTSRYQTTDDLRTQVQQLTNEVQQLRAELAARGGQSPQATASGQKPPSITLILKDGRRIDAPGYALVGTTLWVFDSDTASKIPVSDVNIDATQKENQKRGLDIVFPNQ